MVFYANFNFNADVELKIPSRKSFFYLSIHQALARGFFWSHLDVKTADWYNERGIDGVLTWLLFVVYVNITLK